MSDSEARQSRVERINARIRNNPVVAGLIVVATVVIGIASFTDAATKLLAAVSKQSPTSARTALGQMGLSFTPDDFARSAGNGDVAAVKLFLAAGMDPSARSETEGSALGTAAFKGHKEVVAALLGAGARTAPEGHDPSALSDAAAGGHADIVKLLIDKDGSAATIDNALSNAMQIRLGAAPMNEELVQLLIARGAEVAKIGPQILAGLFRPGVR